MAKELIRVPRVLGESYNSVLIERLYEAGGNVMLDLIIYLGSYHLKDLFGTSWFSVEDFCRKMGYDRTNLQRKLDSRQLAAMFGKNMQPEYVCTDTAGHLRANQKDRRSICWRSHGAGGVKNGKGGCYISAADWKWSADCKVSAGSW